MAIQYVPDMSDELRPLVDLLVPITKISQQLSKSLLR